MKEQGCILTFKSSGPLSDGEKDNPQLLKFVRGSYEYAIIYITTRSHILSVIKNKTLAASKKPYVASKTTEHTKSDVMRVDLNDPDSLEKIIRFL